MSASDRLLFHTDLKGGLKSSLESKRLWLESVCIAVHDFTVVNKRTPSQQLVTDFFSTAQTNTIQPTSHTEPHSFANADTTPMPALTGTSGTKPRSLVARSSTAALRV
eukprot:336496-Ditylum_brightwellii.AAC.1